MPTILGKKTINKRQVPDTWMHKARHLAAAYKVGGIRDSLTNSFSNVATGDVTKRLRWDTREDAVSGKLYMSRNQRLRKKKEEHTVALVQ